MSWRDKLGESSEADLEPGSPDLFFEVAYMMERIGTYKGLWQQETDGGKLLESFLGAYDPEGVRNLGAVLAQLFEMCELIVKHDPKASFGTMPEATNDPKVSFDTVYRKAKEISDVIGGLITRYEEKPHYRGPDMVLLTLKDFHLKNYIDAYEKQNARGGERAK